MSERVEWMDVDYTSFELADKGDEIGEDKVTGEVGLVISADEVVVIEGDAERLLLKLDRMRDKIASYLPKCKTCGTVLVEGKHRG